MNRTYVTGIALVIAVLGIVLLGNTASAEAARGCCEPAACEPAACEPAACEPACCKQSRCDRRLLALVHVAAIGADLHPEHHLLSERRDTRPNRIRDPVDRRRGNGDNRADRIGSGLSAP